jgi:hypothetical protein
MSSDRTNPEITTYINKLLEHAGLERETFSGATAGRASAV